MTKATKELVCQLCEVVDNSKYLLLSGPMAVGKTYIAQAVAAQCGLPRYNAQGFWGNSGESCEILTELIPIHPSFSYEDFVRGISMCAQGGSFAWESQDKVFLQVLKKAKESWSAKENKKYFLILDDIGRGSITGILGDVLSRMEPGRGEEKSCEGERTLPPNLYLIATYSTAIDSAEPFDYGLFRHFYSYTLENDYRFLEDGATEIFPEYDTSPNAMFYRTRRVVEDNLRHRYQLTWQERERYLLGHGMFQAPVALVMRYQVIPMLKQYVKDGVVDGTAGIEIDALERLVTGAYSKEPVLARMDRITGYRTDVTADVYYREALTHRPIVNLIARIKTQGLLTDTEIADTMLFHPGVLVRKSGKLDGIVRYFPAPAYLYVKRADRDLYTYGTTVTASGASKRPRFFYSAQKDDVLTIDGTDYAAAAEMQPKEYTRWDESLNSDAYENERGSSSPNSIMFRILRSYYNGLIKNYDGYLLDYPEDDNIRLLGAFAREEFDRFIQSVRQIGSGSDEAEVNLERNRVFREAISKLTLLWKDKGDLIEWKGQSIKVEGVYKVDRVEKYGEYARAMELLGIHQMILQGPPGTSKTYSAREYLKFVGKGERNEELLSDEELDSFQIQSYQEEDAMAEWEVTHPGQTPAIAWDIVQFHPSYGYEDFVRGIEVSTVKDSSGAGSAISYDTVNKVLGSMARLAASPRYQTTKFFLVIDEINRANLATVFGELIYGLEYRGKGVATPYTVDNSNKVLLPDNLYILGTMNTADKSIGGIDYAIRRRFLFFSLLPDANAILNFKLSQGADEEEENEQRAVNRQALRLFEEVEKLFHAGNLNPEYYKDDVQIGHTYFMVSTKEQLYLRFKYQILPILREYFKDGMFQFEMGDASEDGWSGLLGCITGEINVNYEEHRVREIFEKLIEEP